jgi:hypothetical protein
MWEIAIALIFADARTEWTSAPGGPSEAYCERVALPAERDRMVKRLAARKGAARPVYTVMFCREGEARTS